MDYAPIVAVMVAIFWIVVWWRIFEKLGWPGVTSLLMLVPVIVPVVLILLAWVEWPIHKELDEAMYGRR